MFDERKGLVLPVWLSGVGSTLVVSDVLVIVIVIIFIVFIVIVIVISNMWLV